MVLVGAFATTATITILTIAIPAIARDLGTSVGDTAWVLLAPIVVSALVSPSSGRAADAYGRKRMWLLGFGIAGIGVALSAVASSLTMLIAARVITGAGTALALPAGLAIAIAEYEPAEQGIPIGWWTSTTALAPAAGVLIGGFAVEHLSWRWLFYGQLPLIAATLALALIVFREHRVDGKGGFDYLGALLGGVAIFALLLAVNRGHLWGWTSPPIIACLTAFVVSTPWFVVVERRAANPVLPVSLLADPVIKWAVLNRLFLHSAYMGSFIVIPVLLMELGGWAPVAVAMALLPRPIAMGIAGPIAGVLTTRLNPARLSVFGSIGVAAGVAYLAFLTPTSPYAFLLLALVAMGFGLGMGGTAASSIVTSRTHVDELGTVSGFLGVVGSVATSLGMATMVSVISIAGGETRAEAFQWSFGVGAALALLGVVSSVALLAATRRE